AGAFPLPSCRGPGTARGSRSPRPGLGRRAGTARAPRRCSLSRRDCAGGLSPSPESCWRGPASPAARCPASRAREPRAAPRRRAPRPTRSSVSLSTSVIVSEETVLVEIAEDARDLGADVLGFLVDAEHLPLEVVPLRVGEPGRLRLHEE